jgi:hypothetical protein
MTQIAESIHLHVENLSWLMNRHGGLLDRLAKQQPHHPNSMAVIDLFNAERTLRELADKIAHHRALLTTGEQLPVLQAAE